MGNNESNGSKILNISGWGFFGMRVIKLKFRILSICPFGWNSSNNSTNQARHIPALLENCRSKAIRAHFIWCFGKNSLFDFFYWEAFLTMMLTPKKRVTGPIGEPCPCFLFLFLFLNTLLLKKQIISSYILDGSSQLYWCLLLKSD